MNIEEYNIKIEELKDHDIDPDHVLDQLNFFRNGKKYVELERPATLGDGIFKIPKERYEHYLAMHKIACKKGKYMKFVPASGAASRMFKAINSVYNMYHSIDYSLLKNKAKTDVNHYYTLQLIDNLELFAFFGSLKKALSEAGIDYKSLKKNDDLKTLLDFILTDTGLNLSSQPKGLIEFHNYAHGSRTPFQDHIIESLHYIKDSNCKMRIHFTVSKKNEKVIRKHIDDFITALDHNLTFEINYSFQKKSTDTIAVTPENVPFRNDDGSLLFRPGGHGALIDNLNELNADKVFIKNIDNIVPDHLKEEVCIYKKLLAGYLEEIQEHCFVYIRNLENEVEDIGYVLEAAGFCSNVFSIKMPQDFLLMTLQGKSDFIRSKLDRPIRVCGMVKNEGEPGGGPYWVKHNDGSVDLQIVEKSQINIDDENQNTILTESTHFNPVDIVCSLKNYKGEKFDLMKFIDKDTGYISNKSKEGRELQALELPGLWNGAMSDWNTVFIEVPKNTFSPVKTVNELLRQEHRS